MQNCGKRRYSRTDEDQWRGNGRIERQKFFGRLGLLSPEKVARISLRGLLRRKAVILPGWSNRINGLLLLLIPIFIRIRLMSRVVARELDVPPVPTR